MLTDDELEAIAARRASWQKAAGTKRTWYAARLTKEDVPAMLRTIAELTAERDAAVVALQGTEQVA